MRLWIDTEFNGFGGQLLSIALVGESHTFYREVGLLEPEQEWVAMNVLPYMEGGQYLVSFEQLAQDLSEFLCQWDDVDLVADWPDDFKYLMEALIIAPGYMVNTPKGLSMSLRRDVNGESQVPHHAMWDALGNMKYQLALEYFDRLLDEGEE